MKLAEALMLRAQLKSDIEELRKKAVAAAKIQEGESPIYDVEELIREALTLNGKLAELVTRINGANRDTAMDDGVSLADALVSRDALLKERHILRSVVDNASEKSIRYGRAEIKDVVVVDVPSLEKRMNTVSADYRRLDARIQAMNWTTELPE
jgi:hypothetical protein